MNSRVLREIPLKILRRKIGDEHVTLLQACYANPIFNEESAKSYPSHNGGSGVPARPGDFNTDGYDDGLESRGHAYSAAKLAHSSHVANDYMHSLPPSPPGPHDVTFHARRKRSRYLLVFVVCLALLTAVTIGLLVHFVGRGSEDISQSFTTPLTSPSPTVITLASIQGSLTIVAGPFAVFHSDYGNPLSDAYILFRNAFIYKMDTIFMSSSFADMYNRTQILYIREVKGHVLLTYLIHVTPESPVPGRVIGQIGTLILAGLNSSLFLVDRNTFSLKTNTISPPVTTTVMPGQCQPISLSECVNQTEYRSTTFPNVLGHRSQREAQLALRDLAYLFHTVCYGYHRDFYCSVLVPECGREGEAIPPCRQYCLDVTSTCAKMYIKHPALPFSCDDLPDSDDPLVCRQNPYKPGVCVPVTSSICLAEGFNHTAYPNLLGGVTTDKLSKQNILLMIGIQQVTSCFKHTPLFTCAVFNPPCSGQAFPNHYIPPCRSLCQAYRDQCEIFLDIFKTPWPPILNCSDLPDSPDTSVCVGYSEAREPDIVVCKDGEVECGDHRCIKASWLCDGFQDCDDNSDESHCATCGPDELACSPASGLCIDKSLGCDGTNDCYMDVDETYCVRMSKETDSDVLEVFNSNTDQWEEVCMEGWTQEMSDLTCRQLGYKRALFTHYEKESSSPKSKFKLPKNGSDETRLQSYMDKGHMKCNSGYVVKLECWETVCGLRPAHFQHATRIVGGEEVKPGSWPWMASLHGGAGEKYFCSATIIAADWILTAAHCVGGAYRETSYWTVIGGGTRRVAYSEHRQSRHPKGLFPHPDFNSQTVENDIALIQLDRPLAMNDFVRTICLPQALPKPGTRCIATGWGKTGDQALSYEPAMREVSLDVTSSEHCKKAMKTSDLEVPYAFTRTMFCAGGTHEHDACQGDSGGPLVCRKENTTDEWYQGGIVSWGVSCAYPNIPGVYTNLPLYLDWIRDTMANHSSSTFD